MFQECSMSSCTNIKKITCVNVKVLILEMTTHLQMLVGKDGVFSYPHLLQSFHLYRLVAQLMSGGVSDS